MIKELFLHGNNTYIRIDVSDIDIVRKYSTPFFSKFDSLQNDSTLTIKVEKTEKTQLFFEHVDRFHSNKEINLTVIKPSLYLESL